MDKFMRFVIFFSAGFWNWIESIFWIHVLHIIWCAYKKNFRTKISKSSFEVLILVAYLAHLCKNKQNQWKLMKINETQGFGLFFTMAYLYILWIFSTHFCLPLFLRNFWINCNQKTYQKLVFGLSYYSHYFLNCNIS